VLGPHLAAGAARNIDPEQLDALDPALVDAGVRAFFTDFAAVGAELPWLRRACSVAPLGARHPMSVSSASGLSPGQP
jgi:hypothetical protein